MTAHDPIAGALARLDNTTVSLQLEGPFTTDVIPVPRLLSALIQAAAEQVKHPHNPRSLDGLAAALRQVCEAIEGKS